MTVEDIRGVTFETVRKGYRVEDVDDYLQQVAVDMERLIMARDALQNERDAAFSERDSAFAERDAASSDNGATNAQIQSLIEAKEDAENKMYILAEKVEEYRGQEDTLTTALINAQRMGETVVKEAKQKAENMIREATGHAELLRQRAEQEIERERGTLEKLTAEVTRFKATILNLYKQHIESLSAMDPPVIRAEEVLEKDRAEREEKAQGIAEGRIQEEETPEFYVDETIEPVQETPTPVVGEAFDGFQPGVGYL